MTVAHLITIGGSDAAGVLGVSPFTDPVTVAARKLGLIPGPVETERMRIGTLSQAWHAQWLEHDGSEVMPAPAATLSGPPFWTGTPDAYAVWEGERIGVEMKWRGTAPSDAVRLADTMQAMHYLHLTGLEGWLVSEVHGGHGGMQRTEWIVERDPELIEVMRERYIDWLRIVRAGELPAPDGSDSAHETIRVLHPDHRPGEKMRATVELEDAVYDVRLLDEQMKALKARRERLAQRIQLAMGGAETLLGVRDDRVLARYRTIASRRVNTTLLKQEWPQIAADCETITQSRRFEVNL